MKNSTKLAEHLEKNVFYVLLISVKIYLENIFSTFVKKWFRFAVDVNIVCINQFFIFLGLE